jgi:hypothetical protein
MKLGTALLIIFAIGGGWKIATDHHQQVRATSQANIAAYENCAQDLTTPDPANPYDANRLAALRRCADWLEVQ